MIFPKPQKITENATRFILSQSPIISASGGEASFIKEWCADQDIVFAEDGDIAIKAVLEDSRRLLYVEESRRLTDEKYIIRSDVTDSSLVSITITYAKRRGLRHALNVIGQQICNGELIIGEIEDYPLFHRRGYIEGFYGKPWTPEERNGMLKLMAYHRMNTYYYGPKDDPYHREKWNELYPQKELLELETIINLAKECFVDFYFCIAPGLSMRYTSEDHYIYLTDKIKQIYNCGVKNFGLLLDDIPENLHFQEDIEAFNGETVNAHIYLANRLYDDLKALDADIKITLCPLQYNGKGNEYFISKLGQGIEPGIDLFWTGRNICSQELTVPQAVTFINSTHHRPLYWDNFPVNDAEMVNEMHLGYIAGRDSDLYRYSEGIISNCMEFCESSKIPLLTVADYLWNPIAYDPLTSWDYAMKTIVGEDSVLFKYFADNLLTSCLKVCNSPLLSQTLSQAEQEFRTGNTTAAFDLILDYKTNLNACCELLKNKDTKLFRELVPWSRKLIICSDILNLGFEYLSYPKEETRKKIEELLFEFIRMPEVLTDFSFKSAVDLLLKY